MTGSALSGRTVDTAGTRASEHGWLRRLAGYCWRYRRTVLVALAGALAATVATAAIPLVQRQIIDDVIVTHRASIWPLAGLLVVAAAVNFGGIYLRRYRGGRLSLDVQHDLRTELFDSLSRLDGARQDEIRTGQLVGRAISDLNMVQGLLSMVPVTLGNIVLFVLTLGIMVVLSPVLTLVTVAVAPALWIIALASRRKLFPASWDAQQQSGEVAGVVDEAIGGVRVVKGFGQEEQEQERLEAASSRLFASRLRMIRLTARYNPALTAIPSLGMVGVLALGGWLAIHGSITLGTFLAFSAYLAQMAGPVRMLTYMVTLGQEARASVIRVFDIIDSRPAITDKPDAIELPPDAAGLSFDDVRFGYIPNEPVLRGLSLRVEPGETVAVVGASGSGKSTLALLLPRFYDPQAGSVRIGGHDVADVTRDSLRAAIGLVMEDSFLFSDTVRANIAYGLAGRDRRAGHGGGPGRPGARVHRPAAAGLRHRGGRAGPYPVRRPAAAGGAGPGAGHRPQAAGARRRDLGHRPAPGGRDPRRAARGDAGPDHADHRAPPVHAEPGRPDRGAGRRPGRRHRHARRTRGALPAVPAAHRQRGVRRRSGPHRWKTCWTTGRWPRRRRASRPGRVRRRAGPQTRRRAAATVAAAAGPVTAAFASLPPSPELLAQVDALPPAADHAGRGRWPRPGPGTGTSRCAGCCGRSPPR